MAAESAIDWDGDGEKTRSVSSPRALRNIEARIDTIKKATKADQLWVAFSCPSRRYWRSELLPDYKANRTGPRPMALTEVKDRIRGMAKVMVHEHLEADDLLGITATTPLLVEAHKFIIVTSDKDLRQIPGRHLNHNKLAEGITLQSKECGDAWHLTQTLIGDVCDNYKGCPGIGPKKAVKYVARGWAGVLNAFISKGLTEADALVQARVAKILQYEDWDARKKAPILWSPKP